MSELMVQQQRQWAGAGQAHSYSGEGYSEIVSDSTHGSVSQTKTLLRQLAETDIRRSVAAPIVGSIRRTVKPFSRHFSEVHAIFARNGAPQPAPTTLAEPHDI